MIKINQSPKNVEREDKRAQRTSGTIDATNKIQRAAG